MSEHFDEAYLAGNHLDDDLVDDGFRDINDIFDLAAATEALERHETRDTLGDDELGQSGTRTVGIESDEILSDDDDGLFVESGPLSSSELDEEEADDEGEVAAQEDKVLEWRIDHSSGDHKLKVKDFIAKTASKGFDGTQALEMLHRLHTLDYGSRQAGSKAADAADKYYPLFFLDYISIVGRPLRPITQASDRFFDNVIITLKDWHLPYPTKHAYKIPFDLMHRTFRIATAATRETWYIVMHPIVAPAVELLSSRQKQLEKQAQSSRKSALRTHHAQALASHIKKVFLSGELLGERVEPSWNLNSALSQKLTSNKWTIFQERFMEDWAEHVEQHAYDSFWMENEPVFHAYDYGANIQIEVSDGVQALQRETRLRPREDSDDGSDNDLDEESDDGSEQEGLDEGSQRRLGRMDSGSGDVPEEWPLNLGSSSDRLYCDGLKQLATELDQKYELGNISSISYALAVDLNCVDSRSVDAEQPSTYCLLADRNAIQREYRACRGASGMTFYPMAFHPAYGNFSSPGPPRFLQDHVFAVMKDNMSFQNDGADVLSCDYFQAYSNIKRLIRYNPEDLLVTQGIATAALTVPVSEAQGSARVKTTRQRLLRQLHGDATPDDRDASRPFARERQRIEQAVAAQEFAFRMEQIISLDVARLVPSQQNLRTILRPIFQLMRFYLQETPQYTRLLRCFRPTVFPQILGSFARVFELAMGEMLRRFRAQGSQGLGIALAEGVAVLDRLGHYCFTGTSKALAGSVLGPLKTIESLKKGAWPYVDPQMLDVRHGEGILDVVRWPRAKDGRPILLHMAALRFHYGPDVAASRHSLLWFRDLGGKSIGGPAGAGRFLEEVFRDLWIPQMVAFVSHQLQRRLVQRGRQDEEPAVEDLEEQQQQRALVETWVASEQPFSWRNYEAIWRLVAADGTGSTKSSKSRQDFAREVYQSCVKNHGPSRQALSSQHSTWFAVLHAVFSFVPSDRVSEEQWLSGLAAAMVSNRIECMPGSHRSRITYRRVVMLVGVAPPKRVSAARPGSLKREAMEAEWRVERPFKRRVIDLGSSVPFREIPGIVEEGFRALAKMFVRGNPKILEHYHVARNCLEECLGDPLCDVLLMLVVTLSSSSVTPFVGVGGKGFEEGARKDPAQFAANLATRMLWFLRPQAFPWEQDSGQVLRISEMTKKIEHKGVSNRLLRELGWVQVQGNRPNPRNSEMRLQSSEKLLRLRKELLSLRKDAGSFLGRVFSSEDTVWVERCSKIVKEGV